MDVTTDVLRIGKLAECTGVSVDTIRHYERLGLLPKAARTSAGYRQYPASVVHRVRLVQQAVRFGFSLRELTQFLRVRESGGAPCRDVRASADRILKAVDERIVALTAIRRDMRRTLEDWDRRIAEAPAQSPARLLESLEADGITRPRRSPAANLKTGRAKR